MEKKVNLKITVSDNLEKYTKLAEKLEYHLTKSRDIIKELNNSEVKVSVVKC